MDDFVEDTIKKRPTKTLQEYQEIVKQSGMIWRKPFEFNAPVSGLPNFDDFFVLAVHGDVKLCKFTIEWLLAEEKRKSSVIGIQFFYKKTDGTVIEGYFQRHSEIESKGENKTISFDLADDEYPIKMVGRAKYSLIYKFGFITNKGNNYSFGGEEGEERQLSAPKGLHFTRFGSVHSTEGVLSILCESNWIPDEKEKERNKQDDKANDQLGNKEEQKKNAIQPKKKQLNLSNLGMAIQNIFYFLSLKEVITIFRLNQFFSEQKYLPAFLNRLAKRIIYSCNIQSREYLEGIMKDANMSIKSIQMIADLLKVTENKVKNPFGNDGFEGFEKTRQGGSGIQVKTSLTQNYRTACFQTSYAVGELQFQGKFADYFDEEFMSQLLEGKAAIVAGCYMKNAGFAAMGYVTLIVRDEDQDKEIFRDKITDNDLPNQWRQMFIKYFMPETNSSGDTKLNPTSFKLQVGGSDKVYWAGFFGNLISGITFRGIPFTSRSDRQYFTV